MAGPDGTVVPDLAERLPGRGAWVTADRAALEKAAAKGLFARGLKARVSVPDGLVDTVERLLARRAVEAVSLARKAGAAVCGFERVREGMMVAEPGLLLAASDGAADGKRKLARLADDAPRSEALDSAELGLAFGRESVIHAALFGTGVAARAVREVRRLEGLRSPDGAPPSQGRQRAWPDERRDGEAAGAVSPKGNE